MTKLHAITFTFILIFTGNSNAALITETWTADIRGFFGTEMTSILTGISSVSLQVTYEDTSTTSHFTRISDGMVFASSNPPLLFADATFIFDSTLNAILNTSAYNTPQSFTMGRRYNSSVSFADYWGLHGSLSIMTQAGSVAEFYSNGELNRVTFESNVQVTPGGSSQPVPEPTTILLFATSLAGLLSSRLRKKKSWGQPA